MVKEHLRDRFPDSDEEGLDLAVALSRGNVGRAEDILSGKELSGVYDAVSDICRNIKHMDAGRIAYQAHRLSEELGDTDEVLDMLGEIRAQLPAELKKAQDLIRARDEYVEAAKNVGVYEGYTVGVHKAFLDVCAHPEEYMDDVREIFPRAVAAKDRRTKELVFED